MGYEMGNHNKGQMGRNKAKRSQGTHIRVARNVAHIFKLSAFQGVGSPAVLLLHTKVFFPWNVVYPLYLMCFFSLYFFPLLGVSISCQFSCSHFSCSLMAFGTGFFTYCEHATRFLPVLPVFFVQFVNCGSREEDGISKES